MAISHTNRKGQVYYLHQGKTSTGKPKYFFSKKADGDLIETMPEGFEVYEKPGGQVYLRKIVPREVTDAEIATVEEGVRRYSGLKTCRIDVEKNSIVVYTPDQSEGDLERFGTMLGGDVFPFVRTRVVDYMRQNSSYSKMMRFVLRDKERRLFSVQRWCFRGSIDNWTWDLADGKLETLVKKYAPHLGKESFYDLM